MDKVFKLHWKMGEIEIVQGEDIADACRRAGIGHGALAALDHWEEVTRNENNGSKN